MTQCASYLSISIEKAELTVKGEFDQKGKFGLPDIPSALKRFSYELDLKSPATEEQVLELIVMVERCCYATNTLRQPAEVVPKLKLNGREVPVDSKI
ncbi:MAG: hypothetical protein ACE5HC_07780 [Candidatus Binatia bacterium]